MWEFTVLHSWRPANRHSGLVVDAMEQYGYGEQGTFRREGPHEGMKGPGVTKIDHVLTNKAGFALIERIMIRWDLPSVDHVPIEVTLNIERYNSKKKVFNPPPAFPIDEYWASKQEDKDKQEADYDAEEEEDRFLGIWEKYEMGFDANEKLGRVQECHRQWCQAAVEYLKEIFGSSNK